MSENGRNWASYPFYMPTYGSMVLNKKWAGIRSPLLWEMVADITGNEDSRNQAARVLTVVESSAMRRALVQSFNNFCLEVDHRPPLAQYLHTTPHVTPQPNDGNDAGNASSMTETRQIRFQEILTCCFVYRLMKEKEIEKGERVSSSMLNEYISTSLSKDVLADAVPFFIQMWMDSFDESEQRSLSFGELSSCGVALNLLVSTYRTWKPYTAMLHLPMHLDCICSRWTIQDRRGFKDNDDISRHELEFSHKAQKDLRDLKMKDRAFHIASVEPENGKMGGALLRSAHVYSPLLTALSDCSLSNTH